MAPGETEPETYTKEYVCARILKSGTSSYQVDQVDGKPVPEDKTAYANKRHVLAWDRKCEHLISPEGAMIWVGVGFIAYYDKGQFTKNLKL